MCCCQVMHGGLSGDHTVTLDDITSVSRNRQPPESGKHNNKCISNVPNPSVTIHV